MSFGCCLWPSHWKETHHWDASPVDTSPLIVSFATCFVQCWFTVCQPVLIHVVRLGQLIGKQGLVTVGCRVNQTYFISRAQHSALSWAGSVQLLHHATERRFGPAGGGCQGGDICPWPQRHLQETCFSKGTFVLYQHAFNHFHLGANAFNNQYSILEISHQNFPGQGSDKRVTFHAVFLWIVLDWL